MSEYENECFSCGIEYNVEYDEAVLKDGIKPKFCPFCQAGDRERELDELLDWDEEE